MRLISIIFLSLSLAGCATTVVYNPPPSPSQPEVVLNENGLNATQKGMTLDQVHKIMGKTLVIGYQSKGTDYIPVTLPNPYKNEPIMDTDYFVEYYINSIYQPDGIIHDNELMPLIFKNGTLVGRGWTLLNTIRSGKPPA